MQKKFRFWVARFPAFLSKFLLVLYLHQNNSYIGTISMVGIYLTFSELRWQHLGNLCLFRIADLMKTIAVKIALFHAS